MLRLGSLAIELDSLLCDLSPKQAPEQAGTGGLRR